MKVLLTIDTEVWPSIVEWPQCRLPRPNTRLQTYYEHRVLGRTSSGDFGLTYLLNTLNGHGLSGIFFVESLYASAVGPEWLAHTVNLIQAANQEVQLHVHPEWLFEIEHPDLPQGKNGQLDEFSVADQTAIIKHALANLQASGAKRVSAVRAGSLSGSLSTLQAARNAGLHLDFSLDATRSPAIRSLLGELRRAPPSADVCASIPLSFIEDFPGHFRPAHLTALSFAEMKQALYAAARGGWPQFVILLHPFDLVSWNRSDPDARIRPHRINIGRWVALCKFLAMNQELFKTVGCNEVEGCEDSTYFSRSARTSTSHAIRRIGEQLVSRVY